MLAVVCLMSGSGLAAQSAPSAAPSAVDAHHAEQKSPANAAKVTALTQPAPIPPAPKAPDWPANNAPTPATIVWDSHGLQVTASNSSLKQILSEISIDTGAKIDGMGQDERIFGSYGPGPARDIISQLLDGSNYDVAILGDQGSGTPTRVVLTARSGAAPAGSNASPAQPSDEDNAADEQAEQPDPQPQPLQALPPRPNPEGAAPQMTGRTQQQLIEEMQERQRQLQQQQQQQQSPQ